MSLQNSLPSNVLFYTGSDHGCKSAHGQCYWTDLEMAKTKCQSWTSCEYLYQSDLITPATRGNPVYWARARGSIVSENGAVTWYLIGK